MTDIVVCDPSGIAPSVLIGCVGYEHRSLAILRNCEQARTAGRKLFFDYQSGELHSYVENARFARDSGVALEPDLQKFLDQISECVLTPGEVVQLDVTSFDRRTLALILQTIFSRASSISSVVLSYFPRTYSAPSGHLEDVQSFGPVTSAFIGEVSFSRENLSLVVGAGYEYGRIVGAIDMLEPERTYCMYPFGTDRRFEEAIFRNNLEFSFLDDPLLLSGYNLLRPESQYFELRRIVEFELRERNVLLLPLGPKIFAAISLLVALTLHPAVMVWRHSTVSKGKPDSTADAFESGTLIKFAFRFVP